MRASAPIIQITNLSKTYSGEIRALDDLTLAVEPGEIFGYLGPNGAGKTTTIRLLLDLIRPTSGAIRVFGLDARADSVAIHQRIGFLPGELNLWKGRTGAQIMRFLAQVRGLTDLSYAHELAERFKLDLSRRARDYSSGNRRKLGLVVAMMHRPDLLILDEPTGGLDPLMQQTFNQIMLETRTEGRTVFLSSHVLSEVQAICDRVAILRDGQLKAVERVERLTHVDFRWVEARFRDPVPPTWGDQLAHVSGVSQVTLNGNNVRLRLSGDFDPLLRALQTGYVENLRVSEPTLEEIFLTYYGNGPKGGAS